MSNINHQFEIGKPNSKGVSPITYKFNLKGNRFKYGTSKKIIPQLWDKEIQRATTKRKLISNFQKELPTVKTDLQNINQRLENIISATTTFFSLKEEQKVNIDFNELKEYLNKEFRPKSQKRENKELANITIPQVPFIKDLIHEYIKGMFSGTKMTKKKTNYNNETIKAYLSFKKMWNELEQYFKKQYIVTDISLDFESELHEFFNDVKEYGPNTKGKMIKILKVIINDFILFEHDSIYRANKNGLETSLTQSDLLHIERQLKRIIKPTGKTVNIALNEKELKSIFDLELSHKPNLERARDIFLTGCYTGLRYSDYSRIRPEHINNNYLQIIPIKTKTSVNIPINPELSKILRKWDYTIPDMTSQELGRYVKEIGQMAGITQNIEIIETIKDKSLVTTKPKFKMITTHTARRSFSTNMFYNGMDTMDIMIITGHKRIDTFEKYIIRDPNRELERMERNSINRTNH